MFCEMRNLEEFYDMKRSVGSGTYGHVYMAENKENDKKKMVALKQIKQPLSQKEFHRFTMREIRVLQQIKHPNVVELFEVCRKQRGSNPELNSFFMVFELCPLTLATLMDNRARYIMTNDHKKTIMHHILQGLCKLHSINYMHRDMKPNNILISKGGVVKLADFGMAKPFANPERDEDRPPHINTVVHVAYRAPELLLGDTNYAEKIDIWSLGCMMAHLWLDRQLFGGTNVKDQLFAISNICGSINKTVMPNCETLPYWAMFTENQEERKRILPEDRLHILFNMLRSQIPDLVGLYLLDYCLKYDPNRRVSAKTALSCIWFRGTHADVRDLITHKFPNQIEPPSSINS